jgi:hypothetical protein
VPDVGFSEVLVVVSESAGYFGRTLPWGVDFFLGEQPAVTILVFL